jgi:hypothetical protein
MSATICEETADFVVCASNEINRLGTRLRELAPWPMARRVCEAITDCKVLVLLWIANVEASILCDLDALRGLSLRNRLWFRIGVEDGMGRKDHGPDVDLDKLLMTQWAHRPDSRWRD